MDLPITAVTISPGGAVVTRSGSCPAGDQEIGGLPADLEADSLSVVIAGQERPVWRYRVAGPTVPAPAAPARRALEEARIAVGEADLALARAQQRAAFARLAVQAVAEPERAPGAPPRALPLPADGQAVAAFVRTNLEQAAREEEAARAARDVAVRQSQRAAEDGHFMVVVPDKRRFPPLKIKNLHSVALLTALCASAAKPFGLRRLSLITLPAGPPLR